MNTHFDTDFVVYAVNHVNEDHADAMLTIFKHTYKKTKIATVTLLNYNAEKMIVNAFDHSGKAQKFEIPFLRPLQNAKDFRHVLIEMLKSEKGKPR